MLSLQLEEEQEQPAASHVASLFFLPRPNIPTAQQFENELAIPA